MPEEARANRIRFAEGASVAIRAKSPLLCPKI
jgi:hypothetical protein